jgi:hypothetical protein
LDDLHGGPASYRYINYRCIGSLDQPAPSDHDIGQGPNPLARHAGTSRIAFSG